MDTRTKTIFLWSGVAFFIVAGIVTLFLYFSGSKAETDVNAIYTSAAITIAAQQQTLQTAMTAAPPTPLLSLPTVVPLSPLPAPTFQLLQTPALQPTFKPVGGTAAAGCEAAVYVSDVTIPDGTNVAAGQTFTKTWKVANKGSCAWAATYQLVFVGGNSLNGKSTPIGKTVNPGESADISVVLTAPSAAGTIKGTWRLANDNGQAFGDGLTVVIVSGKAGAAAVTATEDPNQTDTAPTEEPVAATEVPTEVATDVPAATEESITP